MTPGALDRIVRRASAGGRDVRESCELCSAPVAGGHGHVLDERQGELLCACRACALLFERDAGGRGQYRLVPDRRVRVTGVRADDLGVPVGLAFFVVGLDGAVVARYPSPAGATEWAVDPAAWSAATAGSEVLASMCPVVEALLVNTVRGADEHWLVPVDDCYRLVGAIKETWTGLSGGKRVWAEVETFFDRLAGRRTGPVQDLPVQDVPVQDVPVQNGTALRSEAPHNGTRLEE